MLMYIVFYHILPHYKKIKLWLNDQHTDNCCNYPTYNTIIYIKHNTKMQCNINQYLNSSEC